MRSILCAAHAGGQGKTTLAQLVYLGLQRAGANYKLASADFVDETGRSKIGKMYPQRVTEFGVGAELSIAKKANDMNASLKYWDRLGRSLLEGGIVVDLGANVVTQVIEWARTRRVSQIFQSRKAPPIDVMLVCRAEKHAIDDISDLVRNFSDQDVMPISRIYIVLNEAGGSFSTLKISQELNKIAENRSLHYLKLPRCTSELWHLMELNFVSLEEALNLSEDEAAEKFDIDIWEATSGVADLRIWFDRVYANMKEEGVFEGA